MNFSEADFVARVAFKAMGELTSLISLIRECTDNDEEYEQYRNALIQVSHTMALDFFAKIRNEHPEVMLKIEECIEEFGRLP